MIDFLTAVQNDFFFKEIKMMMRKFGGADG